MPEENLRPCAYHVVRYQPNLVRDEWVNIGVLLLDPATGRVRQRWLEEPADFARLRRLHPAPHDQLWLQPTGDFACDSATRANWVAKALPENFGQPLVNA